MAKYRQLHTSFWQDSFIMDLTPEDKYFFMYLLTNPKTTQCGIYELPYQMMQAETGYNRETVKKLIDRFQQYGKIVYSESTKEVCIVNWMKYNYIDSFKVKQCIESELKAVKDRTLIGKLKGLVSTHVKNTEYQIPATINKRQAVWVRDRGICQYTLKPIPSLFQFQVDHVLPSARGGSSRYENLVAALDEINLMKSDRTPEEAGLRVPSPEAYHGKTAISDLIKDPELLKKFNSFFGKDYYVDGGVLLAGTGNVGAILDQHSDNILEEEEEREEEREENNKPPISPLQGEGVCEEDDFDSELDSIFSKSLEQPTQKEKSCAKKEKGPRRTFQKPTAEEVKGYMVERGWKPDMASREGESFCNYYESNGWKVGRNKMSDWKATVRNWIARRENDSFGPVSIHKNPKAPQRSSEEQLDRVKTGALNAAALFMAKNNGTYGTE